MDGWLERISLPPAPIPELAVSLIVVIAELADCVTVAPETVKFCAIVVLPAMFAAVKAPVQDKVPATVTPVVPIVN